MIRLSNEVIFYSRMFAFGDDFTSVHLTGTKSPPA